MKELQDKITDLEMQLRMSKACTDELREEVNRLKAGIQSALDTPTARAWILEHTVLNGVGNCCGGRCQGEEDG